MKKKLLLFTIILSLISCVATAKVHASETTWYEEAANKVDNPVILESDQYYEGVSINSNVISDLTFLQIPFEKYLNNEEKHIQVIAFTEALYKEDDNINNEVVMYLYSPDYDVKSVLIEIDILSKEMLQNGQMNDVTPGQRAYHYQWTKVSNYENIYKFSFAFDNRTTIKKLLLSDSKNHTIVSTIYDVLIKEISCNDGTTIKRNSLLNDNKLIDEQQFNFIYEKTVDNQEAVALLSEDVETPSTHYLTSIAYNETVAKVDGTLFRLRYDNGTSSDDIALIGPLTSFSTNEHQYTDFFYYFFNVTDTATDKAWSGKEVISKIEYTYYEYLQEYNLNRYFSIFPFGYYLKGSVNISYLNQYGEIFAKDVNTIKEVPEKEFNNMTPNIMFNSVIYREPSTLESIYQSITVEPGTIENKYPVKKDSLSLMDYFFGTTKDEYITQMPYLFSTSDTKYVSALNKNIYSSINTSDYQYGLLIGNKGYSATNRDNTDLGGYKAVQSCVELVSVDSIWYEYEGEKYHATVTETIVDDSLVNTPIVQDPENPMFPTVKVPSKNWWELFIEWLEENWPVLLFTFGLILVIAIIIKVIRKITEYRAHKIIIDNSKKQKNTKKKE